MEHRLVTGGAEYLPFARRCVAKLKKLGLSYAGQSFDIGGVSVKVRIEPGHEYIRIDGGTVNIYSGVVKYLANTNISRLINSFRPTTNAWERCMRKSSAELPSEFSTDTFILKNKKTPVDQYRVLAPSMFSGLMTKAVAVLMARGLKVEYQSRWDTCHGVTMSSDGIPWVVEITLGGILATKMKVTPGRAKSKIDAERVSVKLFGGIPDAGAFPSGDALLAALDDGSVIRLASAEDMAPYFACIPHAAYVGWSFGEALSVAYNAVALPEERTVTEVAYTAYIGKLFKLTFSISGNAGSATLSELESGELVIQGGDVMPMRFDTPSVGNALLAHSYYGDIPAPGAPLAPLFVCHINDTVEIIRLDYTRTVTSGYGYLREIVEGRYPEGGTALDFGGGGPFVAASPHVVEIRTYIGSKATGSMVMARSRVEKVETDFDEIGSYVSPSGYRNYVLYRITIRRYLELYSQWLWNNYRSRDTLIQFDAIGSSPIQVTQDYGAVNRDGYDAEVGAYGEGAWISYHVNGNLIFPDIASSPPSGSREVWLSETTTAWFNTYLFRTWPPFKMDVFWASGAVTRCVDLTERDPVDGDWVYKEYQATANGVPRYIEEQILPSEIPPTSQRQFVVAMLPVTLFSDGLLDQQDLPDDPHPRIQYTFIGASGTYLTPAG